MRPASPINNLTGQNVELIDRLTREANRHRTPAEHIADSVAAVVGSWTFIGIQSALLAIWVGINIEFGKLWDPYPFVLLNLVLSFQAAFATPIIMMSQNRQGRLADRRNHLDLQINLLAEQESTEALRLLHQLCEKLDVPITKELPGELEHPTDPQELLRQIDAATATTGPIPDVSKEHPSGRGS